MPQIIDTSKQNLSPQQIAENLATCPHLVIVRKTSMVDPDKGTETSYRWACKEEACDVEFEPVDMKRDTE